MQVYIRCRHDPYKPIRAFSCLLISRSSSRALALTSKATSLGATIFKGLQTPLHPVDLRFTPLLFFYRPHEPAHDCIDGAFTTALAFPLHLAHPCHFRLPPFTVSCQPLLVCSCSWPTSPQFSPARVARSSPIFLAPSSLPFFRLSRLSAFRTTRILPRPLILWLSLLPALRASTRLYPLPPLPNSFGLVWSYPHLETSHSLASVCGYPSL